MENVYIISELCGQWGGSIEKAKTMIDQSREGGADAVKVQLWDTWKLPGEDRGKWEYLSMSKDQLVELMSYAYNKGIVLFASPFDEERFGWTVDIDLEVNKIASSMLEWDKPLCDKMVESRVKTYCSLGKWSRQDPLPYTQDNVIYMHCLPFYPHSHKVAMENMPWKFSDPITGYSDHSIGIESAKEAIKRGATTIEKHFTLDHNLQSFTESAHACSMNLEQLRELREFCDDRDS